VSCDPGGSAVLFAIHAADEGDVFVTGHLGARLMMVSFTPSQFDITSKSGRLVVILSFHTSAPAITLPA
jgi:hypothetical protein